MQEDQQQIEDVRNKWTSQEFSGLEKLSIAGYGMKLKKPSSSNEST